MDFGCGLFLLSINECRDTYTQPRVYTDTIVGLTVRMYM